MYVPVQLGLASFQSVRFWVSPIRWPHKDVVCTANYGVLCVQYGADGNSSNKESVNRSASPREELQRKERENLIERKRKEAGEGKEKKSVREAVPAASTSTRANSGTQRVDSNKEKTVLLTKESADIGSGTLQILSTGGESGSRAPVAGKGSNASGAGEISTSGDAREPHKREYKRKQLLVAKDKDKESAVVSVDRSTKAGVLCISYLCRVFDE